MFKACRPDLLNSLEHSQCCDCRGVPLMNPLLSRTG